MKKILFFSFFIFISAVNAQIKVANSSSITPIGNSSAFIDASSSSYSNSTTNLGKGLAFPRVSLTTFVGFGIAFSGGNNNFPSRYDGMLVYNTATGLSGIGSVPVKPGFYYYRNTSTTNNNSGTWLPVGSGNVLLSGTVPPVVSMGADGDFYIDTTVFKLYGPKVEGAWPSTGALIGGADYTGSSPISINNRIITLEDNGVSLTSKVNGVLPVANGGTGASNLSGYIKGNGTDAFSTLSSIPVTDVSEAVRKVNGNLPDVNGNVVISFGEVKTGLYNNKPPTDDISLKNGDIYVVSGDIDVTDSTTGIVTSNNGRTFIFDYSIKTWNEVTSNQAATDARYVKLSGSTMAGDLVFPTGKKVVTIDAPKGSTDVANKAYVDKTVSEGTPDANTTTKGKIQLGGDLAGTNSSAEAPVITDNAITTVKLANAAVTDAKIAFGIDKAKVGLEYVNNTSDENKPISILTESALSLKSNIESPDFTGTPTAPTALVTTNTTQIATTEFVTTAVASAVASASIADATALLKGKIQLGGDLAGTNSSAEAPVITDSAITTVKLANAAVTDAKIAFGIDKAKVGLENVNNTSDENKPISILTESALSLKSNIASPDFTGTPTAPTALVTTNTTQIATTEFVTTAVASASIADATALLKGKIQLGGDLAGTNSSAEAPVITDSAITAVKLANAAVDLTTKVAGILPVTNGGTGTGADGLTGYLKGNGIAAFSTTSAIPVADVTGAVQKVNGSLPDSGGNVAISFGEVKTGLYANLPAATDTTLKNGDIYVVSGDSSVTDPITGNVTSNNGRTYIFDGIAWQEVTSNQAATDSRYVKLGGGVMKGNLNFPTTTKITIDDLPTASTDVANKKYVDDSVVSGAPDANATTKGKIQLAGDLTGTAELPVIAANAITTAKISDNSVTDAKLSGVVLGAHGGTGVDNTDKTITLGGNLITIGSHTTALNTSGDTSLTLPVTGTLATLEGVEILTNKTLTAPVLSVTPLATDNSTAVATTAFVNNAVSNSTIASATKTKQGKIQLGGDLAGTGSAADAPVITDSAITTAKLANSAVDLTTKVAGILPVANGGTGAANLSGYLKGNGTSAFSTSSSIPVVDVTGAVQKVNGSLPDSNGNVAIAFGKVSTGTYTNRPVTTTLANNGDIYVVSGDTDLAQNGRTFITDGITWQEVTSSQTATDARYVKLTGSTMEGNLTFPTGKKAIIVDAPTASTDAVNKNYVDTTITAQTTPDATGLVKGKIQLGGDLAGAGSTAAAPVITNAAVTYAKMQSASANTILGNPSMYSAAVQEIATTGTGNVVRAITPTLVTPVLGVATATSINGITPTATGTGFTLAGGTSSKTLTVTANVTLDGTQLSNVLASGNILVGNGTNIATSVTPSGDVTISNNGATTLANGAKINGVLTGFISGAGTVAATDTVLQAIQKINGNAGNYLPLAGGTMTGGITGTSLNLSGQLTSTVATGTAPFVVSSTSPVTNLSIGGTATNATNITITNDVATTAAVYPTFVTSKSGNLPQKVSDTKLSFIPSTGILSATKFSGDGSALTGVVASTNANLTGPITSSGNATSIASQTGTGTKFVMDTSPTLSTPVLGGATATIVHGLTPTAVATGFTIAGGTSSKTLTVTANVILDGTQLSNALPSAAIFVGNNAGIASPVTLGGDAIINNTGVLTLKNSAVTNQLLTGLATTTGTVTASDNILQAIGKINANAGNYLPLAGGIMTGDISGITLTLNNNVAANTTTIGGGTTTGAITIGGAGEQTISIGNGAAAKTVTLGSANTTSTTIIAGGTGTTAITLDPAAAGGIVIGDAAGTGTITLGSSTAAQTTNIANGTGVATVNIANASVSNASIVHIGSTASLVGIGVASDVAPTSTFQVAGSMANAIRKIVGADTVLSSDYTLLCDTTAEGFTLTLPLANTCKGRVYVIRKIDETTNVLTLPTIKYSVTTSITSLNFLKTIRIQSDGTDWYVID